METELPTLFIRKNSSMVTNGDEGIGITEHSGESLERVTGVFIEDGIEFVGYQEFEYSSELETVVLPDSITEIGMEAFYRCRRLRKIAITPWMSCVNWEKIEDRSAFERRSLLSDVQKLIPDGLTIGAFHRVQCIPKGLLLIHDGAFGGCASFPTPLVYGSRLLCAGQQSGIGYIPKGVDTLDSGCFSDTEISSITIPDSICVLGHNVFEECESLKTIIFPSRIDFYTHYNGFGEIRQGVLGFRCCSGCSSLAEVTLPSNLKAVGSYCFKDCHNLEHISLPESVTEIWGYAFSNSALKEIKLPYALTEIGEDAFKNCDISEVILPENVTKVCNGAFSNCGKLRKMILSPRMSLIPVWMCGKCEQLEELVIPEGIQTIERNAFFCTGLKSVKLPNSVSVIQEGAFEDCKHLEEIAIPNSACDIAPDAFSGCPDTLKIIRA